jgi:cyclase
MGSFVYLLRARCSQNVLFHASMSTAGQVTRGVQFGKAEAGELRNVGDPVELAVRYNDQGADEMVFFDIYGQCTGRGTMVEVIERVADRCFMPLTVGGGIRTVADMGVMLKAGADQNQHQFRCHF